MNSHWLINKEPGVALWGVVLGMALLVTPGCGPSTDRLPISGKVMLDGQPLDSGSIRFSGNQGERKLSAGGRIRDGAYNIPREKGLPPGEYHLQITSPSDEMMLYRTGPDDPGVMVGKDRIPKSYNLESTHKVELTPSGENQFDFDIVSEP